MLINMTEKYLNQFLLKARRRAERLIKKGKIEEGILNIQIASLVANRVLATHPDWYKK